MPHHDHEVEYPVQAPISCVTSAIGILRSGDLAGQRKEFGLDVYNIQGFGQRVFLGMPDDPHPFTSVGFGDGGEEGFTTQLRELCEATASAQGGGSFSSENFGARDWKALLKWFMENIAPLLLPLILENQT